MARALVKWSSLFQLKKEGRGTPGANKPNYVKKITLKIPAVTRFRIG
jgi:hypothetical protein